MNLAQGAFVAQAEALYTDATPMTERSVPLRLKVDSAEPLYEQIARQIREEIVAGDRIPGSRLRPIREMSKVGGVSYNTVAFAYRLLEEEGFIRLDRKGAEVLGPAVEVNPARAETLGDALQLTLWRMQQAGMTHQQIMRAVDDALAARTKT